MCKKIYLDVCCRCRPYDDLSEPRNYREAVLEILRLCALSGWRLAASEVIEAELLRIINAEKLENVKRLYEAATDYLILTDGIKKSAAQYQQRGLRKFDGLHLATAETNRYSVLLTTDGDFRRAALKLPLRIKTCNPVEWLETENSGKSANGHLYTA